MKQVLLFLLLVSALCLPAQLNEGLLGKYYFNEGLPKNDITAKSVRVVGVSVVPDRFGNEKSAFYLHGNIHSYINLGTDSLVKPKKGTIAIWFKIDIPIEKGMGLECNPIIRVKNRDSPDFNEAYDIIYDYVLKKLVFTVALAQENQVTIHTAREISLREWHHAVIAYDDDWLYAYLDGVLENKISKKFKTIFMATDSVMVGNMMNVKNHRFFNGSVDDICIYNRVLSQDEITALYNESDPKKTKIIIQNILYALVIILIILFIVWLVFRYFRNELEKEREKNALINKSFEQEIRILKAQMNPHFIFNSLNSIQQFIIVGDNDKAQAYLTKFSRLLRHILNSNLEENISIHDEVEILKRYLEVESIRFSNVFEYSIEVDKNIEQVSNHIPHFIVQPFIENAIWHGLLPKDGEKKLSVIFKKVDNQTIECTIEDNGVGRTEKKNTLNEGKSMAVNFIRQRLEMLSLVQKHLYEVKIIDKKDENNKNSGVIVKVTMPLFTK